MTDEKDGQKPPSTRGLAGMYRPDRHRGFDKAMETAKQDIEYEEYAARFKATYAPDPGELRRTQHADRIAAAAYELRRDFPHPELAQRPVVRLVAKDGIEVAIADKAIRREVQFDEEIQPKILSRRLAELDPQTRQEVHRVEHGIKIEKMGRTLANMDQRERYLTHEHEQRVRDDNKQDDSGNKL